MKYLVCLVMCIVVLATGNLSAQDVITHNENSLHPVEYSDIMWRKQLWFRVDLRQKANMPFFAQGNEMTKFIIEAVKAGKLTPYKNDSLLSPMPMEDFLKNLEIPGTDAPLADVDDIGEECWGDDCDTPTDIGAATYTPRELCQIDVKEDMIFDKRHSRMKHDILALTVVIPAASNPLGLDKPLASFSYKELVENVFKDNPRAIYYNPNNMASHMSLASAFELRLFSAQLIKVGNAYDKSFEDMYGASKKALGVAQQTLYKLLEYEVNLWEY